MRHIEVSNLWIQQKVSDGSNELQKIKKLHNPSDLLTKHLSEETVRHCMELMGTEFMEGRNSLAPALDE